MSSSLWTTEANGYLTFCVSVAFLYSVIFCFFNCDFRKKSSSPEAPVFFPKTLPVEADCKKAPETGNGIPAKQMKIMKAKERIRKIADSRWARTLALAVTAAIIFSWLYSHGISPVWTAVAIICFRGLFRFLYRIACFLVALAIILCILSFLVF